MLVCRFRFLRQDIPTPDFYPTARGPLGPRLVLGLA